MDSEIIRKPIPLSRVREAAAHSFGDMVKAVVDLRRRVMVLGGEMHADGERLLLDDGSKQEDLWGLNMYPDRLGDEFIEYTSLINIRPRQNNRSHEIQDEAIRAQVKAVIHELITKE